eukprot:jgi/Botrbrau1/7867/Bobra.9_2s0043.1
MQPLDGKSPYIFGRFEKVTDGRWAAAPPGYAEEQALPRHVADDGLRILTACKVKGEAITISPETRLVDLTIDDEKASNAGVERFNGTSGGSAGKDAFDHLHGAAGRQCGDGAAEALKLRDKDGRPRILEEPEERIRSFHPNQGQRKRTRRTSGLGLWIEDVIDRAGCTARQTEVPQAWALELMSKPTAFFGVSAASPCANRIPTRPLLPGVEVCLVTVHQVMSQSTSITQRPITSRTLSEAGRRESEAFEEALERLRLWTPSRFDPDKLHGTGRHAMAVEPLLPTNTLFRVQAADWMAAVRLSLPKFLRALCTLLNCREEEVVVLALHEHELYVGRCSDFAAMVGLGAVLLENVADEKGHKEHHLLSTQPLRVQAQQGASKDACIAWEPYPLWGTSLCLLSSDGLRQFPIPKTDPQVKQARGDLEKGTEPQVVRYSERGAASPERARRAITHSKHSLPLLDFSSFLGAPAPKPLGTKPDKGCKHGGGTASDAAHHPTSLIQSLKDRIPPKVKGLVRLGGADGQVQEELSKQCPPHHQFSPPAERGLHACYLSQSNGRLELMSACSKIFPRGPAGQGGCQQSAEGQEHDGQHAFPCARARPRGSAAPRRLGAKLDVPQGGCQGAAGPGRPRLPSRLLHALFLPLGLLLRWGQQLHASHCAGPVLRKHTRARKPNGVGLGWYCRPPVGEVPRGPDPPASSSSSSGPHPAHQPSPSAGPAATQNPLFDSPPFPTTRLWHNKACSPRAPPGVCQGGPEPDAHVLPIPEPMLLVALEGPGQQSLRGRRRASRRGVRAPGSRRVILRGVGLDYRVGGRQFARVLARADCFAACGQGGGCWHRRARPNQVGVAVIVQPRVAHILRKHRPTIVQLPHEGEGPLCPKGSYGVRAQPLLPPGDHLWVAPVWRGSRGAPESSGLLTMTWTGRGIAPPSGARAVMLSSTTWQIGSRSCRESRTVPLEDWGMTCTFVPRPAR